MKDGVWNFNRDRLKDGPMLPMVTKPFDYLDWKKRYTYFKTNYKPHVGDSSHMFYFMETLDEIIKFIYENFGV